MFSNLERVTRTLICGPSELMGTFMFEGAMHWAKEGQRVIYVTPSPIEALPPKFHDGCAPTADIFQLVKFMYLPDYKSLMEVLLIELDTYAALPTALLIDNLENYTLNSNASLSAPGDGEILVAKTCSVIIDAMNACSRIMKKKVHILAALCSETLGKSHFIYFDNIWQFSVDEKDPDDTDGAVITLKKTPCTIDNQIFKFRTLEDRTIVLKEILRHRVE